MVFGVFSHFNFLFGHQARRHVFPTKDAIFCYYFAPPESRTNVITGHNVQLIHNTLITVHTKVETYYLNRPKQRFAKKKCKHSLQKELFKHSLVMKCR
jgi:hypothetical protein